MRRSTFVSCWIAVAASASVAGPCRAAGATSTVEQPQSYEEPETRALVARVDAAAALVATRGEAAFAELGRPGTRWREKDDYVFVLRPSGDMVVHPDPSMQGRNEIDLKDVNGKPIIRGLIAAATTLPDKPQGWYHYEWPVPGGLLPRWKSSYVRLVTAPSGARYVVGSGMYDDRMERPFVVDIVRDAAGRIEKDGDAAFAMLRDPTGPFLAKDAYVFVVKPDGVEIVNPAFPNLEGRNLIDTRDAAGKALVREMLAVVEAHGAGWVDYMWPRPGESVATRKSTYVTKAKLSNGRWLLVGCGVYLADAPKALTARTKMTAPALMALVRDGAALLARDGDAAYPAFRRRGSKWFRDDTYFFVWALDGTRVFHAADPSLEGQNGADMKDVLGRPYGRMFLDAAASPTGEGWVHYMYPRPGEIFPAWKSVFVKRVTMPSGKQMIIGSGVYEMQMDRAFIEDVVDRAAALVAAKGKAAFPELRDKQGPFYFMDTYVFVDSPDGTELVNPAQPSLEGTNLMSLTDVKGKHAPREYIRGAMDHGSTWVKYEWYKPGRGTPAPKHTYARKVQSGGDTYVVAAGYYE